MFPPLDLRLGTDGLVLVLRWPAIDLIPDSLPRSIPDYCILALFRAKIAAVSIDCLFFSGQKLRYHRHIMRVGSGHFYCMCQATVLIHTDMRLVAEMPCVPLLDLMRFRVPFFLLVLRG